LAFYRAIAKISILDPTCGSGAFLFAALNILEPIYDACLDRMQGFIDDCDRSDDPKAIQKYQEFREILVNVGNHNNRRYFILKSIMINNLYGVDIMEEATEICKLRLFLKLVSQVEADAKKPNYGIEPLPDIDFNIRAGNTLVGFATLEEVRNAVNRESSGQGKLLFDDTLERIENNAVAVDKTFQEFKSLQSVNNADGKVLSTKKTELRSSLGKLNDELDRYLADEYEKGQSKKPAAFQKWKSSHQPFHWFVEFYGIVSQGGFDVIIGNPPYLEQREVNYSLKRFRSSESKAIHAMCIERSSQILLLNGTMSMILPLSIVSTQRMKIVQEILENGRNAWYANYSWRPAKLFDNVNRALTIFTVTPAHKKGQTFTTNYQKWTSDSREELISKVNYIEVQQQRPDFWMPKMGDFLESSILKKCLSIPTVLKKFTANSNYRVYCRTTGGLYWKVFTDFAPAFSVDGVNGHSTRETFFTLANKQMIKPIVAILSSNVFWWWYTVTSNCRDLNPYDVQNFPVPESALLDEKLVSLGSEYLTDLQKNSTMLVRNQKQTGITETQSFKIQKSKPIIDEIDRVLAQHYGFTDEELDFIINYDIKYRMGKDDGGEE
jgi:hypothetical protein